MRQKICPKNSSLIVFSYASVFVFLSLCVLFMGEILWHGLQSFEWSFLTELPRSSGRKGGISSVLVNTLYILAVCLLAVVPIGLMTAVKLSDFSLVNTKRANVVRHSLDILAGVPSIVFGLFGNALFSKYLGLGFSIWSGGSTLACMVLPLFIRLTESSLSAVNHQHRINATALGVSKTSLLWNVIIPSASPGILIALVISIGRALSETAALIFTSGYVDRMPESLMDSGRSLSIHIYDLSMNVSGGDANAYRTALVLMALLLVINTVAKYLVRLTFSKRVYE